MEDDTRKIETETHESRFAENVQRRPLLIVAIVAVVAITVGIVTYWILSRRATKTESEQAPAAASTGTVKFLMEQQWLVRMKLAQVEENTVARQITSTGRVVPAANNQALVAPPVSGLLTGRNLPRVGQYVARGQTVAIVQQVATASDQAQVRAAAATVAVENARLEAEQRAVAG